MSLVLITAGTSRPSRVRTLSAPLLAAAALVCAGALLVAGAAAGYLFARDALPAGASSVALADAAPPTAHPMTLEQLGVISGRIFRLESLASELANRIGALQKGGEARAREGAKAAPRNAGSGGPMLPPRDEPAADTEALPPSLAALDAQLSALDAQLAAVSDAALQQFLARMRLPTRLPVADADLTSRFGNRVDPFTGRAAFHAGLDFSAEAGTPILAAAGGKVSFAGFRPDYGYTVEIDHGNGLATRYAHASALLVRVGRIVVPGERIATVGSTGRSTGAHLHFEVLRGGVTVDPKLYLAGL